MRQRTHSPPRRGPTPAVLAVLGLVLMVGGWKVSRYVPLTPQDAEEDRRVSDVRRLAEKDPAQGGLAEALGRYSHQGREPPYRRLGDLAFLGGLALFVTAGVLMYRQPAAPEGEEGEAEEAEEEQA